MLFAERHGKLGRDGSRAHDRAEDLLTSTAFQLLRYLPLEVGLLAVLRRVRAAGSDGRVSIDSPAWLKLDGVTEAKYDFWPRWGKYGEPDVVVELFAGTRAVGRFVIEVKLESSKSSEAGPNTEEETAEEADPDQLRKYWQGLRANTGGPAMGVVYLTSHAIPPAEELAASIAREPADWLGWLSWRDVWTAVRGSELLPARDLAAVLAAKGLKGFDGFGVKPWFPFHPPRHIWMAASVRWFAQPVQTFPPVVRHWASIEEAT